MTHCFQWVIANTVILEGGEGICSLEGMHIMLIMATVINKLYGQQFQQERYQQIPKDLMD